MSVYNWESSSRANRKKVKKTGTVVFHTDEAIDTSFDRLLKEVNVERLHESAAVEAEKRKSGTITKSALMTEETIQALQEGMKFEGLLPCQAQCYRGIFNGRDVILHSRTGSGKTLAYALPIIERHLLLEQSEKKPEKSSSASSSSSLGGPFLIIFVFSNDLAVQTRGVLEKLYKKRGLSIAVAGFDDVSGSGKNGSVDILIGTIRTVDEAIRGRRVAAAASAAEEKEKAAEEALLRRPGAKQPRTEEEASESDEEEDDDEAEVASTAGERDHGAVSAANVRAIVIDEVDTTLGFRYTNVGRRMKNLLKFVRKANGSLAEGLLHDYRAHHYVLCGATIPNWVLKAGFLGVKKYYYQLVAVGSQKLPAQLECFEVACPVKARVAEATRLLQHHGTWMGRVVVFGAPHQVRDLEAALATPAADLSPAKKKSKKESAPSSSSLVVRTLTGNKDEVERIAAMEEFNSGVAQVLLCTDIAARGLDFTAVDTVLMLSLPQSALAAETFVHRAGRTARVNRAGRCVLLHDASEAAVMDGVSKSAHVSFKALPFSSSSSSSSAAATASATTVTMELTVRNPLRYKKPAVKAPTAMEVLKKQLEGVEEGLYAALTGVAEVAGSQGEKVRFSVPRARAHEVTEKLWKYSLQVVEEK